MNTSTTHTTVTRTKGNYTWDMRTVVTPTGAHSHYQVHQVWADGTDYGWDTMCNVRSNAGTTWTPSNAADATCTKCQAAMDTYYTRNNR